MSKPTVPGTTSAELATGPAAARRVLDEHQRLRRQPRRLVWHYALGSALWLLVSDLTFEWWIPHDHWRPLWLLCKGALFVAASAWLIFRLQRRANASLLDSLATLEGVARGYTLLAADLPIPCLLVDLECGVLTDANEAAARLYGWRREDLCGKPLTLLLGGDASTAVREQQHLTRDGGLLQVQVFRTSLPLPSGVRELWVCVDTTLANHAQELLRLQAQVDPLTGLANRAQVHERVAALLQSMTADARLALLLVDIDQFKLINDTRGHAFGDLYLRDVAARLSTFAGPTRMVGRFGGDEFVVCLAPLTPREDPMTFAEAVRAAVSRSSVLDGVDVATTCSVGVAVFPEDGTDADSLFSAADAALDRAKTGGRNHTVRFRTQMRDEASRQVGMIHRLRQALDDGEIFLRYQPLFALDHGGLVGIEALAAWRTGEGRDISAAEFIPAAERSGLIVDLGYWAFGEALAQRRRWIESGRRLPPLAVNVSPSQLQAHGFAEHVITEVRRHRLEPGELELEITETVALHVDREVQSRVRRLAEAGISIVVDDFGRGYSSLSHFTRLPIHKVKIDASFVRHIDRSHDKQAIVRSMLSMAGGLGLYTVAEGVERAAEAAWLFEHGCQAVQGFLYARPSRAEALGDWLHGMPARS